MAPARHRQPRGRPDRPRGWVGSRDEPVSGGRGRAPVIEAPFRADAAVAARLAELGDSVGAAVAAAVAAFVSAAPPPGSLAGSTVAARDVARLVERHGLASARVLALLA